MNWLNPNSRALAAAMALCLAALVAPRLASADVVIIPSLVKDLGTTQIAPGGTAPVVEISPAASNLGQYTVPAGKVFMITTISVFPTSPGPGVVEMQLVQDNVIRSFFVLPNTSHSQLQFPSGLVIATGFSMSVINRGASAGPIRVTITGYEMGDR